MTWGLNYLRKELAWPSVETAGEIGLYFGIGVVLAGIHVLVPPSLQSQLALDYQDIQWWSIYTSAVVHHSDMHLLSNLVGFSVATGIAYGLAREMGHRRWVRLSVLTIVVVGPAVISFSSYVVWTQLAGSVSGESRGFSGLVGACVGLAYMALLLWIGDRWQWAVAWWAGLGLYLLGMVELSVIYTGGIGVEIGMLAGGGLLWTGWQLVQLLGGIDDWRESVLASVFVGLVVVLLGLLVFGLFPSQLTTGGGSTTNIVAHGVGLVVGVVISVGVWLYCQLGFGEWCRKIW